MSEDNPVIVAARVAYYSELADAARDLVAYSGQAVQLQTASADLVDDIGAPFWDALFSDALTPGRRGDLVVSEQVYAARHKLYESATAVEKLGASSTTDERSAARNAIAAAHRELMGLMREDIGLVELPG